MRLWPRSLFGRLALLLLLVIVVSQATALYLFRQDRAQLIARQFSETKLVQLRSLRAALATGAPRETATTLARFGEEYHARIVPDEERRFMGTTPQNRLLVELQERLRNELGPETELRIQPRLQLMWIKLSAGERAYWAGFPLPRPEDDIPSRALAWSLIILALLLVSAYAFARYLSRPLRQLNRAVTSVGQGRTPSPLPENGPSEIVNLNRGFNQMLANLRQIEQDRAVWLAGVSHDLRTPLARLRLGIEVAAKDDGARDGMVADIEEMDKIISQFLDFARNEADTPLELKDLSHDIIAPLVERYQKNGQDVHFSTEDIAPQPVRVTAMSRLLANLLDNALRHGRPPVSIAARRDDDSIVVQAFHLTKSSD